MGINKKLVAILRLCLRMTGVGEEEVGCDSSAALSRMTEWSGDDWLCGCWLVLDCFATLAKTCGC